MTTAESLFEQAMKLDEAERTELAERLYASITPVDPEWEDAWRAEAARRWADFESGRDTGASWDEVRSQIFARFQDK